MTAVLNAFKLIFVFTMPTRMSEALPSLSNGYMLDDPVTLNKMRAACTHSLFEENAEFVISVLLPPPR